MKKTLTFEAFCATTALLLFFVQMLVPFESLDLSIARAIYRATDGAWFNPVWWKVIFYKGAKFFTAAVLCGVLISAFVAKRQKKELLFKALILAFLSAIISLLLMLLMKHFSGVACPWDFEEFSPRGSVTRAIAPFSWVFTGGNRLGGCWPAGHASTGFCLFGLWFASKRLRISKHYLVLAAVILFGLICGVGRMANGAHFLSHTTASALLGFSTAGILFSFFMPEREPQKRSVSVSEAALFASLALTLLSMPFFSDMTRAGNLRALLATASVALLLFFLWWALFSLFIRLMPRFGWRILLFLFALIGAGADAFTTLYGTVMTPDMLRNALATDPREAAELIGLRYVYHTAIFATPGIFFSLFTPRVIPGRLNENIGKLRFITSVVFLFVFVAGCVLSQFSFLSSYMRNNKEARYLIEPAAVIYSFGRTFARDSAPKSVGRDVIDPNPKIEANSNSARPLFVVVVVGETVRAANWGLNGYNRDTTPKLRKRGVLSFTDVSSCGTSTDVSLPCMFSRVGRANYDRARILKEESILSVIERAGVTVRWVDNQSGSKGASTNSMNEAVVKNEKDCPNGVCFDKAMLGNVKNALKKNDTKRELLVLHSIGNHGPAYWRRVPKDFQPFGAGCRKDDFGECSKEEIVTSYDNAIAYTDSFLSEIIDTLTNAPDKDTVLLYVSDHGESLGEKSLWLHGAPYWMHLTEQGKVPMLMWFSEGARERFALKVSCVRGKYQAAVSHDNLASSLLTLTEVKSSVYEEKLDLVAKLKKG